ncbi:hypothetical protein ABZ722_11620 [Streptomyces longwoodensis]|uniref:DUF6907 domain-containing protein n=1 Tax=Streptomyces longwoodensis TaxID=68231 RepID=UPI0033D2A7A0
MSTEPNTVPVTVLVTRTLEIPEPTWCAGHDEDRAQFKPDVTHNGPETAARIETRRGPARFLTAWVSQAPFGVRAPEPLPVLSIEAAGDVINFDSAAAVRTFTDMVRAHCDVLDQLGAELERIRAEAAGEA